MKECIIEECTLTEWRHEAEPDLNARHLISLRRKFVYSQLVRRQPLIYAAKVGLAHCISLAQDL